MNLNWFFLTLFYSGHSPKAPGTVGTLVSLPLGIAVLIFLGPQTLFLLTLLVTLVAIKSIDRYEAQSGIHDNQKIVIDELVGMGVMGDDIIAGFTAGISSALVWEGIKHFLN